MPLDVDGEALGWLPAKFEIVPRSMSAWERCCGEQARTGSRERRRLVSLCWWCLLAGLILPHSLSSRTGFEYLALRLHWARAFFLRAGGATAKRGFWLGWLTGFVTNMGGFWWISHVIENFGGLHPAIASSAALSTAIKACSSPYSVGYLRG